MTANDKNLLAKANAMDYIDWPCILDMIKSADSEETKESLSRTASLYNHLEEAAAGDI